MALSVGCCWVLSPLLRYRPPARADSLQFAGTLGNDVDLSDSASAGKGTASLSLLDTATKTVSWTVEYSGLSGAAAIMQCGALESPTARRSKSPSNLATPIKGSKTLTDGDVSSLKAGHWICLVGTNDDEAELGGELHAK